MKLQPQSYYAFPGKSRIIFSTGCLLLGCMFFWISSHNFYGFLIKNSLAFFLMYGSTSILFSKIFITNEKVSLAWSPFITTMYWSDAIGIKIGVQHNIPGRSMFVRLKKNKLAYFTIEGLSEQNLKEIILQFNVKMNDNDSYQSDAYEAYSNEMMHSSILLFGIKVKIVQIFNLVFSLYIAGTLVLIFFVKELHFLPIVISVKYLSLPLFLFFIFIFFKYPFLLFKSFASKSKLSVFSLIFSLMTSLFFSPYLSFANRLYGPHETFYINGIIIEKDFAKKRKAYTLVIDKLDNFNFNYRLKVSKNEWDEMKIGDDFKAQISKGNFGIYYQE